jgi:hypothetical protein
LQELMEQRDVRGARRVGGTFSGGYGITDSQVNRWLFLLGGCVRRGEQNHRWGERQEENRQSLTSYHGVLRSQDATEIVNPVARRTEMNCKELC